MLRGALPLEMAWELSQNQATQRRRTETLQRIFESLQPLNTLAPIVNTLVCPPELEVKRQGDDDDQRGGGHRTIDTRTVARGVLAAEHHRANDTTNATGANQRGRTQCTLPLSANVVRLPGKDARDVSVGRCRCKKDAKVSYADVGGETEQRKTWDRC